MIEELTFWNVKTKRFEVPPPGNYAFTSRDGYEFLSQKGQIIYVRKAR